MTRVINIRLKLSDFIDTDLEKTIMDRIKKIENDLHVKIIIYFWIDDSNVNIKSFYDRWKDSLSVKTVIKNGEDLKANEHIFFDIAPNNIKYSSNVRIQAKYDIIEQIPAILLQFYDVAKFTTSDKNIKPQKRNDYED